jgi:PAS domain S-box-containing protein
MLGFGSLEELKQRNLERDGFEPDYPRDKFRQQLEKDGVVKGLETSWKKKDGSVIYIRESAKVARDPDGNVKYYEGTVEDITERKKVEEEIRGLNKDLESRIEERTHELREAQDKLILQERLAVMGQLSGSVGHELRNPLGVISNAIYYLKPIQPDADEKIKEYLNIIQVEARSAEKIINDLLDYSRIKSIDREPESVSDLIHQVLERYPVPDSIILTLNLAGDLPAIYVDLRQMIQVLGNIVLNAYQAMPQGGAITISAMAAASTLSICVEDTGVGISTENIAKIFELLFTTKLHGIGLGLAVCKKLVEANGGRIAVESQPGVGTKFTLFLPCSKFIM